MDWYSYAITGGIIIVISIIVIFLLFFMPKPKCYFDIDDINPDLKLLTCDFIYKSLINNINYKEILNNNSIHFICDEEHIYYDGETINNLLPYIPEIQRIYLTKIDPKVKFLPKKGSANKANKELRCILPLEISNPKKSGIWTDGETKLFVEGELIIYDDSRINSMFNKHKKKTTYLLIIDILRPEKYPIGIATENHNILFYQDKE